MRIIEIVVTRQGETTVLAKGYSGSDCLQASKFLEQALGTTIVGQKTSEYFEQTATQQQIQA